MPTAKPETDWKLALLLTAGLRILYSTMAAVFALLSHPDQALVRSNAFTEHLPAPGTLYYALLGIWERFDTLWYLHIAQNGYDRPGTVVFYPLYPGLIRMLSPIVGVLGSALLISTASSFFLFWGFLRLLRMESPDRSPFRTLALLAVWPASFVFFAGYTEALAIGLVVWCILFAREERWASAATCGFAAGLTRSMGILPIVPLAVMAWRSRRLSRWWIALVPLGTFAYWAWLHATGRPSLIGAYRYWSTDVVAPWTTLWRALMFLAHDPDLLVVINLAALTFFMVAGMTPLRRTEDRLFSAAVILQILMRSLAPPLSGAFRYVLPIYPAYLSIGEWVQTMRRSRFVFVCAALLVFNLIWMWEFLNWSLVL